ncbi:MAG: ferritin-like domain-containing protein [Nannocystaceae bacterium]|nr:ferritin-like domain-containing protein [Nannocystaceae bacterium]
MTSRDHSLLAFRLRILATLGLGAALGHLPASPVRAATTSGGQEGSSSTGSGSSTGEGSSGTTGGSTGGETSGSTGGSTGGSTSGSTGATGDDTGTGTTIPQGTGPDCTGCYGRPYVVDGRARLAPVETGRPWGPRAHVSTAGLSVAERQALSAFWLDAARAEHSSIAGFLRFGLELMSLGAPQSLLARAQQASIDEREHAQACFEMASGYGASVGPGPIDLGGSAPLAQSLEEFAAATVREGCVGETIAAWLAQTLAQGAEDPVARAVLQKIANEEAEHAELSWAALQWAIEQGGDSVREAAAAAFDLAQLTDPFAPSPAVPAHGLQSTAVTQASMFAALNEVVRPCAERLLAA